MLSAVNSMVDTLDDKPWQHSLFAIPLSLAYLSQPVHVCMDKNKGFESKPLSSFKQTAFMCPSFRSRGGLHGVYACKQREAPSCH